MESRTSHGWVGRPLEAMVVASRRITPHTHSILLKKPPGFSFLPTQFTFLSVTNEEGAHTRPMSIATSPTRPSLEYAVRLSDSPFKRAFSSLRPGDTVHLRGPYGRFLLREDRPAVLIAGGIGITPLKGMAEFAAGKRLSIPVMLLYSNRTEEEIAYRGELQELERRNPRFRVLQTLSGEVEKGWEGSVGRIGPTLLEEASRGVDRPVYYVCGKPGMVAETLRLLSESGVPEADLMVEVFRGYGA